MLAAGKLSTVSPCCDQGCCGELRQLSCLWNTGSGGETQLLTFTSAGLIGSRDMEQAPFWDAHVQGERHWPTMLRGKCSPQCVCLSSETGSQTEAMQLPWLEIFRNAAQSPSQFYPALELAPLSTGALPGSPPEAACNYSMMIIPMPRFAPQSHELNLTQTTTHAGPQGNMWRNNFCLQAQIRFKLIFHSFQKNFTTGRNKTRMYFNGCLGSTKGRNQCDCITSWAVFST